MAGSVRNLPTRFPWEISYIRTKYQCPEAHLESHLNFKEERQLPPEVTSFALAITFKAVQEPHQEGLVRRANMCVVNVKAVIIAFRLARTRANDSLS